jgi:hypothetical protein
VIAEVIGTKTESHVRSFFVNYRRRYNLDAALKEYEAEHGLSPNDDEEAKAAEDSNPGTPSPEEPRSPSSNGTAAKSDTNGTATK